MAEILLKSTSNIPYLDQDTLGNFSDMKIISVSGTVFKFNSLLLMSWNKIGGIFLMDNSGNLQSPLIEVLKSHYQLGKDVFISSNFSDAELIVLRDFVIHGKIPNVLFNLDDLPLEMVKLFLALGIDLKYVCQKIFQQQIRKEQKDTDKNADEQSMKNQNEVEPAVNDGNMDMIDIDFVHNIMYEPKESVVQENSSKEVDMKVDKSLPVIDEFEIEEKQEMNLKDKIDNQTETIKNITPENVEPNHDEDNIEQEYQDLVEEVLDDQVENILEDPYKCQNCQKTWEKKDQYDFHMKWKLCQKPTGIQNGSPSKKRKLSSTTFVNVLQKASEESNIIEAPPQTHPKVYPSSDSIITSKLKELSIFVCTKCGMMFDSEEKLTNHQEAHKEVKITHPFQCEYCDKEFKIESLLIKHNQAVHKEKPCDKCDKVFGTKLELKNHKQYYHGEAPEPKENSCPKCDKCYSTIDALDRHYTEKHETGPHVKISKDYECDTCGKQFFKLKQLQEHIRTNHTKSPCAECGLMFSVHYLKKHIMAVHTKNSEKDWPCKVCPKGFAHRHRLEAHMLIHTGERPYICSYCGDTFNDMANQRAHEKSVHLGIKRKPKKKPAPQTDEFGKNIPKKPKGRKPKKQADNATIEN